MNASKSEAENNHTSPSTKPQVIAIRPINKGNVRAVADIGLGPSLTLNEFQVIQQLGQRAWVSPPSRAWQCADGKRHFTPLVELTGSRKKHVEQAILEAWERSAGGRVHG